MIKYSGSVSLIIYLYNLLIKFYLFVYLLIYFIIQIDLIKY